MVCIRLESLAGKRSPAGGLRQARSAFPACQVSPPVVHTGASSCVTHSVVRWNRNCRIAKHEKDSGPLLNQCRCRAARPRCVPVPRDWELRVRPGDLRLVRAVCRDRRTCAVDSRLSAGEEGGASPGTLACTRTRNTTRKGRRTRSGFQTTVTSSALPIMLREMTACASLVTVWEKASSRTILGSTESSKRTVQAATRVHREDGASSRRLLLPRRASAVAASFVGAHLPLHRAARVCPTCQA